MITGLSTACLSGRSETENAINLVKELGAACCEVFLQTFYEYRPEFAKKFAPHAQGLKVNSLHVIPSNFEFQLFSDFLRQRGDGFYWLDQVMRSAQLFGAENYTFHGFMRKPGKRNDNFDGIAAGLREICGFCSGYGVRVCIENVSWCLYDRPGIFRELKCRCPDISGVFDIKQARNSGYPYAMYIKDMSGSIAHAHLSDVDERGAVCLPGRGVYDFEEILRRLKDEGFDGCALIEVYPDNYNNLSELKQSLDFLNEIIYKI